MNQKVFVCHAKEDKKHFVLDFAAKLRAKGVDAWIDRWEIYPGDSIVDRIFEEGIKEAKAGIVVISKYSVNKPWVREELNAIMVRKINERIKLIPVVIDDCQVPECLKFIAWEKIEDLENYDEQLDRIVMSIYGQNDKPILGSPPVYTQETIDTLPDLTKVDSLVLKLSCEEAIKNGHPRVDTASIIELAISLDIPQEAFYDALDNLDEEGYIKVTRVIANKIPNFSTTRKGFEDYARVYIHDYSAIKKLIALEIINRNARDGFLISQSLNHPIMTVNHVLDIFRNEKLIKTSEAISSTVLGIKVLPKLKRMYGT
ncbi:MAG: toll/interleukin-1 receptor domain-containing protein [Candidatus Brocadiales bacterium]